MSMPFLFSIAALAVLTVTFVLANRLQKSSGWKPSLPEKSAPVPNREIAGALHSLKGAELQYTPQVSGRNSRPSLLLVKVSSPVAAAVFLSPETKASEFFCRIGFSHELTGVDSELDRRFHTVTSDPARARLFLADAGVRAILANFARAGLAQISFGPDGLTVEYEPLFLRPGESVESVANDSARNLKKLAELGATAFAGANLTRSRRFWNRYQFFRSPSITSGVPTLLMFTFMLEGMRLVPYPALVPFQTFCAAAGFALAAWLGILLLLWWPLGKIGLPANCIGMVFFTAALLGLIGAEEFVRVNGAWDLSPKVTLHPRITDMRYFKAKYHWHYHVIASSGGEQGFPAFQTAEYEVSLADYKASDTRRSHLAIVVAEGYFGLPWVRSFQVEP